MRGIVQEYAAYIQNVIEDRRKRPRDDLMSILVAGEIDGDRLTDEEIRQESLLILIGGDETTRHVMTGGLEALIRHPDQKRRLLAEPRLLPTDTRGGRVVSAQRPHPCATSRVSRKVSRRR